MNTIKDDRGYSQGYKPSPAMTVRTARRCDYMIGKMDLSRDVKILEIGCGTGEISYLLAKNTGKQVLGTDLCRPFIEEAQKHYQLPNLDYQVLDFNKESDLENLLSEQKFDYIVGNGILHHLFYKLDDSLTNIRRMLNNSGKIIFLEPNVLNPYCFTIFKLGPFRKFSHLEPDEMAFSKDFIEKKLAKLGFNNIAVEYKDFLLPNTPAPLIKSIIRLGSGLEKIKVLNMLSQSIFISASKR